MAYLLLYVDDIILCPSSNSLRDRLISTLEIEFPMSDLGPLSYFLGFFVTRTPSYMLLSKQNYAQKILERASMSSCKPAATPVDTNSKLSADSGPPVSDLTYYCNLVGALRYLTFTHPDIAHAIQQAIVVYCDNVSAIYLSRNPVEHHRTKHVEMDIHVVRKNVAIG
ncbi:uncharacterized mitochondrial protein AtMg00810-like [Beta vulgaris subsp. vulgaris]|uniref:uncharacterized mitochondrial protein AtMg00810-like n=1 Tax=Beta vulgaris subsp. vulgaris TaxID=3555 RepID=UPI000900E22B|nr:uncharacterized mitochondrial protein AtMg00810-like [Beta vulgaris subsp. vulgaris]